MTQKCPWCAKIHDSESHDEGWYFACCGFTLLVWEKDENGVLTLNPVPEDYEEEDE